MDLKSTPTQRHVEELPWNNTSSAAPGRTTTTGRPPIVSKQQWAANVIVVAANTLRSPSPYALKIMRLPGEALASGQTQSFSSNTSPRTKSPASPEEQLRALCTGSGGKVGQLELATLGSHLARYVKAVNLALDRAYSNPERAKRLGEQLTNYKGQGYVLLKKEPDLSYQHNEEFRHSSSKGCTETHSNRLLE